MENRIITIGREFGSGGHEIGIRLSKRLGIPFYDKEIITLTAEKGGISESVIEENEEQMPVGRLFRLSMHSPYSPPVTDEIFVHQRDAIRELAQKGACVIVGRCADHVLRDQSNVIRVFIHASMEYKITRKRGVAPEKAEYTDEEMAKYISGMEDRRKKYYEYLTRRKWGQSENYDLCIRSDRVGIDGAVDTIVAYLENLHE